MEEYDNISIEKIPLPIRKKRLYEDLLGIELSRETLEKLFLGIGNKKRLYKNDLFYIDSLRMKMHPRKKYNSRFNLDKSLTNTK